MVETALEIECANCGFKYWYEGEKQNPDKIECPNCFKNNIIPEDG